MILNRTGANMSAILTDAEETLINNASYTHDYEAEAHKIFEDTGDDSIDKYVERFEAEMHTKYTYSEDLGGLIIYRNDDELVAFYDYERYVGTVFAYIE